MSTINFTPKEHDNGQTLGKSDQAWSACYVADVPQSPYAALNRQYSAAINNYVKLTKTDYSTPAFEKESDSSALYIKEGTKFYFEDGLSYEWREKTPVELPTSFTGGKDYAIYVSPDGDALAVLDDITDPATKENDGYVKMGGFHYSLIAPGTTPSGGSFNTTSTSPLISMVWTQDLVDDITGINKHSLWDCRYRPKSDPRGMTCVGGLFWADVYFCGTEHFTYGTSYAGSDVASGTNLPYRAQLLGGDNSSLKYSTFGWNKALEIAQNYRKRLARYYEFCVAMFGVTETQSLGGSSVTIDATGHEAGYTSKWGIEQCTGHHFTWGDVCHGVNGSSWVSGMGRGSTYGTPYALRLGGARNDSSHSGSRCGSFSLSGWSSAWNNGLRAFDEFISSIIYFLSLFVEQIEEYVNETFYL